MTSRAVDKKVIRFFGREQAFWTAIFSLTLFHFALITMGYSQAFIPLEIRRFFFAELVITVTCVFSLIMMALHATNQFVAFTRWAYLVACFAGALAIGVFIWGEPPLFGFVDETTTILLLLTGMFIAVSMHIEHGGRSYTIRKKE